MNRKAMIQECVQYILDQQHERENLIDNLYQDAREFKRQGMPTRQIRKELYNMRQNSIYWIAKTLAHGKHYANMSYRSCISEALEKLR